MKIGLLLPSRLMAKRFEQRIFAPKQLFLWLADELVERGHTVYVYTASDVTTHATVISGDLALQEQDFPSEKDAKRTDDEKKLLTAAHNTTEYELAMIYHALRHAQSVQLDILHAYHSPLTHYFGSLASFPVLYTLHDPVFTEQTLEYHRLQQFPQDAYNAISAAQKKNYEEKLPVTIRSVIHHGVRVEEFHYSEDAEDFACFIGRYFPEKGIDDAIQVAMQADIPLKIASSRNYTEIGFYKEHIEPFLSHPNIEELPFLLPEPRNNVLRRARVLLFPSKWEEPFGMAMIESMAVGTPVIAYARGAAPEIVVDGKTGFLVNQDDEHIAGDYLIKQTGMEGLKAALSRLYSLSEEEYRAMRKQSRVHVEERFSVKRMVDEYEQLYRQLSSAT